MADRGDDEEMDERFMSSPVSLTAWSHEPSRLNEDVIVDMSLIPNSREGDVAELKTTSDRPRRLYFIVKRLTDEQAKAMPNVQVSTHLPEPKLWLKEGLTNAIPLPLFQNGEQVSVLHATHNGFVLFPENEPKSVVPRRSCRNSDSGQCFW